MRYVTVLLGIFLATSLALPLLAQFPHSSTDRTEARSMVISRGGIAASDQVIASQAAAEILARGGSAADAAIAENAAMGVLEPMMNGMGGDLFAIEYNAKTGKLTGLNSSGWAPEKLTLEVMKKKGFKQVPMRGIYSVTVPGAVAGWAALHERFGRLPWKDLFQPAIYFARHGFPVTQFVAAYWADQAKALKDGTNTGVYLPGGKVPKVGQIFKNPAYARALELIADQGPEAFYRGPIAKAILRTSNRLGGVMSAADLADFKPEWVTPISTTYRGWTVYELPPNGQGMAALEMLNIMERFPLAKDGFLSADSFHVKMAAQQLAYADLLRYIGDPRFVKVPVKGIISKAYAAKRASLISPDKASCHVMPGDPVPFAGDTSYMNVVDSDGNIVSLIQSLYNEFGSAVVVPEYGFALQDRGALFNLDPASPDVIAPHKRPFHTIIPGYMQKGPLHVGFGIMGGLNQPQAHAQFVSNVVDFGMDLQGALEAPRFRNTAVDGCDFFIEDRVPEAVREKLTKMGYVLHVRGAFASSIMGGGHAVMYDSATGMKYAASSPRKDGAAIPEPEPIFGGSRKK
ncbi:MAG: gamma-glutamyltransferase [Acidobacteriota bacterium]|nr:gamma-glutamyltransferase [Acidobacteriota bacterium]